MSLGNDADGEGAGEVSGVVQIARLILKSFIRARVVSREPRAERMALDFNVLEAAKIFDLTVDHVDEVLNVLIEAEIIKRQEGAVRVSDPDALVEAARIDAATLTSWMQA